MEIRLRATFMGLLQVDRGCTSLTGALFTLALDHFMLKRDMTFIPVMLLFCHAQVKMTMVVFRRYGL